MTISLQSENHWKVNQRCVFDSLRPTAQRQIESLLRRMVSTQNRSFYLEEIEKVITYEQNRILRKQRGEEID